MPIEATLFAYSHAEPSFFIGVTSVPDALTRGEAEAFVLRLLREKGDQHLSYARTAILAVRSGFDETDSLTPAFEGTDQLIPWWRVVNVWDGGHCRLVFQQ